MWTRLSVLMALVVLFSYAQVPVSRGTKGPIKDSITDPTNYYVQSNNFVNSIKDFKRAQFVRLDFDFGHKVTESDLVWFQARTAFIEKELNWVTASLCKYWKINDDLIEPYINENLQNGFDIQRWYKDISLNSAVANLLVSPDLTTLSLIIFIPSEENEIQAVRKLYDVLEGVEFNPPIQKLKNVWHEIKYIFWKTDLFPLENENGPKIYLYSWPTTRFAMTMGFFRDTRLKSVVAYTLFFLGFLALYFRFNPQYYWTVWVGTFLPIIFTLGSIWPLQEFLNIRQSVYSLPPIVATLIVSLSFNLQKMETFWGQKGKGAVRWQFTNKVIHSSIHMIALMTFVNFILFGWNMQSLWVGVEMDAVFLSGTIWAWIMAVYFLPALYFFFSRLCGEEEKELRGWKAALCELVDSGLEKINLYVIKVNLFSFRTKSIQRVCYVMPGIFLVVAGWFFYNGKFNTVSEPLKYLPNNLRVVEMAKYPNRNGGPGMDTIQIIFGIPSNSETIQTDEFFNEALMFHSRLEEIKGVRGTFSIMKEVDFQLKVADLEEPRIESAVGIVRFGEENINSFLVPYLHTYNYIQIFAFHTMERSDDLERTLVEIRRLAEEFMARNPHLKIRIFGEVPFFAEMARLIPQQIPQIVITSLAMIFCFYFIAIKVFNGGSWTSCLKSGWILTQTFVAAIGIVGLGMVFFRVPLDMATAAILPIAIAAASDFNVYPALCFFRRIRVGEESLEALEGAIKEKGTAVIVDWLGNSICLSLLVMSYFIPIRDIGVLSIVSLTVCVLWSLMATLPLLAKNVKKM